MDSMIHRPLLIVATLVLLGAGSAGFGLAWVDLTEEPIRHRLPNRLTEISGLALTDRGTVLAHHDERARIYEVNPSNGEILKEFHVGDRGMRGDFEGIAVGPDSLYLVDSDGRLLSFVEGAADSEVGYAERSTGLGRLCEVEGLTYESDRHALLLACKNIRDDDLKQGALLFRFDLTSGRLEAEPALSLSRDGLNDVGLPRRLHLSGVEVRPQSGTWVLIAAQERVLVEVSPGGAILGWGDLRNRWHPQAEGVTFSRGGNLILADEGDGGRGRLSLYPRRDLREGHDSR